MTIPTSTSNTDFCPSISESKGDNSNQDYSKTIFAENSDVNASLENYEDRKMKVGQFLALFPGCSFSIKNHNIEGAGSWKDTRIKFDHNKWEDQFTWLDELNQQGHSIYFTINGFKDGKKVKNNIQNVNAFGLDIDSKDFNGLTKANLLNMISYNSPTGFEPDIIIETKNGFHLYWFAKDFKVDELTNTRYKAIVLDRLRYCFNGDIIATKLTQVLRVPFMYHWKDTQNPYFMDMIEGEHYLDEESPEGFTEKDMLKAFDANPIRKVELELGPIKEPSKNFDKYPNEPLLAMSPEQARGNNIFEEARNLHMIYCLNKLSGTKWVQGEVYQTVPNAGGGWQIWVNGVSTKCNILPWGKYSNGDKGGPSIVEWLKWDGQDNTGHHYGYNSDKDLIPVFEFLGLVNKGGSTYIPDKENRFLQPKEYLEPNTKPLSERDLTVPLYEWPEVEGF